MLSWRGISKSTLRNDNTRCRIRACDGGFPNFLQLQLALHSDDPTPTRRLDVSLHARLSVSVSSVLMYLLETVLLYENHVVFYVQLRLEAEDLHEIADPQPSLSALPVTSPSSEMRILRYVVSLMACTRICFGSPDLISINREGNALIEMATRIPLLQGLTGTFFLKQ